MSKFYLLFIITLYSFQGFSQSPPDHIINDYTAALSINGCTNTLTVQDGTKFNIGDTVMLIQMKGATIDTTNTSSFGNIITIGGAGNNEINYVKAKAGNVIELSNKLLYPYNFFSGKVQLIRVPFFQNNFTLNDNLTCKPWDGTSGGVLVFEVKDTLKLNHDIDVSAKGFLGGAGYDNSLRVLHCDENQYYYPASNVWSGLKGESIATVSDNRIRGKGKLGAGGGGGLGHNSGGAGGANAGNGGTGGYQLDAGFGCNGSATDNRGLPGVIVSTTANATSHKIFMGSGGGAGQKDNVGNIPPGGGNGGGIVIIKTRVVQSNGFRILANGQNGVPCTVSSTSDCHDGMGGGGAGGSVYLNANVYLGTTKLEQTGGRGSNVSSNIPAGRIGPGGGGGGGALFVPQTIIPAAIINLNAGGANGVMISYGNDSYGATPGLPGTIFPANSLQYSTTPFKKNIDSVRIQTNATSCRSYNFNGTAFFNTVGITSWAWSFGDGGTANTQNTSHTYAQTGSYIVKLVATDNNGCKDSFNIPVTGSSLLLNVDADTSFCSNGEVTRQLNASGAAGNYSWSPAVFLNNPSVANPIATVTVSTKFYVTLSDANGCSNKDSITINVKPLPSVASINDTSICQNVPLRLLTNSDAVTYEWTPATEVSNAALASPFFTGSTSQVLYLNVLGANACKNADTVRVAVLPAPTVKTINDTVICERSTLNLNATGAQSYSWSPATNLSNATIANPVFSGPAGTYQYIVNGAGTNSCVGKDTLLITVRNSSSLQIPPDTEICLGSSKTLDGNNGNTVIYNWTPSPTLSNLNSQFPVASPIVTTIYTVGISDPVCNISKSFQVTATVNPLPIVVASKTNDLSCGVAETKLTAIGAVNYLWQPAGLLNDAKISSPIARPVVTTRFLVTGTNAKGCSNKDSVLVKVENLSTGYNVPNSFTPNGDNVNDCFNVRVFGLTEKFHFMIYNREGEKVFETYNYLDCWNGKYKGNAANTGNYVYYLSGKNACGEVVRRGNILLIR